MSDEDGGKKKLDEFVDWYYEPDELAQMIDRLNGLYGLGNEWRATTARKEHKDLYGQPIAPGEIYYKRQIGEAWDAQIKLSQLSLARLVYAIFEGNPGLIEITDRARGRREAWLRDQYDRYTADAAPDAPADEPAER